MFSINRFTALIVLGFSLISILILAFISNKYIFRIDICNNSVIQCNSLAINMSTNSIEFERNSDSLSVFDKAVSVQTECFKVVGSVEENAFVFKVSQYIYNSFS